MSSLIRRVSQRIDFITESRSPLDTDGARPQSGLLEKDVNEVLALVSKPAFTLSDIPAILDAVKNMNGVGIDDRELLLEKLIVIMSRLQHTSVSKKIQQFLLGILYKDLPHPPTSYLSELPVELLREPTTTAEKANRIKYAFRRADGSYNNPLFPSMGKAGSPYARSVESKNITPKLALPDPGLIFDTLLKRDKFKEHPGGISSLFFAFADLVIHSIFNTNHEDWTVNDASSYLDLSVLYGSNEAQVNSVRRNDGSGKLFNDVFADKRLLMMPPASCALLVLLNRNHNFIAQRIFDINENGNFVANPDKDEKTRQDNEIFDRSRLVNCGYFMQIILGDYVGAILGLVRDETDWRLNPLMTMREMGHEFVPTGEGNVVSVEFNLLYRWHATLSQPDTEWINTFFGAAFRGRKPSEMTIAEFKAAAAAQRSSTATKPPTEWAFGRLERDRVTGRFKDQDLAKILQDATEARAGAFGARGIPECLRVIEMMGIQQSRSWGTCSLNEFRKFLGLKPYATFKEWNRDPEIHTAAAALYRDIDNLELHVGLQAEETKVPGPGAGLCPGFTISRAILADAVCLTRGDRFLTNEFTPFNLTAWGYSDCQFDPQDGSHGGLLTKLLFRTLPDSYPKGSAYAHFPFLEPKYMEAELMKQNPAHVSKYDWSRPKPLAKTVPVDDFISVKKVLTDSSAYISAYDGRLFTTVEPVLIKQKDTFKLSTSKLEEKRKSRSSILFSSSERQNLTEPVEEKRSKEDEKRARDEEKRAVGLETSKRKLTTGVTEVSQLIFTKPDPKMATFFAERTESLIQTKSFPKVGSEQRCVDIVKDVINLVPIHWISHILGLPLKTAQHPRGAWYEQPTYDHFADISRYVYLNFDPVNDWGLREASQANARKIIDFVEAHVDKVDSRFSWSDSQNHLGIVDDHSHEFIKNMWQATGKKYTYREFASQLFAAVIPTSALYSQSLAHVVNFYLDEDKKVAREEIVKLAKGEGKESSTKIMQYVYEALRLDPPIPGVYRTATKDDVLESGEIKARSNVFASFVNANQDPAAFGPDPLAADFLRSSVKPGLFTFGANGLLTPEFFELTAPRVVGPILGLQGLQRGPGKSGDLIRFTEDFHGTKASRYINMQGIITPWTDSLFVQYTK